MIIKAQIVPSIHINLPLCSSDTRESLKYWCDDFNIDIIIFLYIKIITFGNDFPYSFSGVWNFFRNNVASRIKNTSTDATNGVKSMISFKIIFFCLRFYFKIFIGKKIEFLFYATIKWEHKKMQVRCIIWYHY